MGMESNLPLVNGEKKSYKVRVLYHSGTTSYFAEFSYDEVESLEIFDNVYRLVNNGKEKYFPIINTLVLEQ